MRVFSLQVFRNAGCFLAGVWISSSKIRHAHVYMLCANESVFSSQGIQVNVTL